MIVFRRIWGTPGEQENSTLFLVVNVRYFRYTRRLCLHS
jgi:hypothetical protein